MLEWQFNNQQSKNELSIVNFKAIGLLEVQNPSSIACILAQAELSVGRGWALALPWFPHVYAGQIDRYFFRKPKKRIAEKEKGQRPGALSVVGPWAAPYLGHGYLVHSSTRKTASGAQRPAGVAGVVHMPTYATHDLVLMLASSISRQQRQAAVVSGQASVHDVAALSTYRWKWVGNYHCQVSYMPIALLCICF
jgi:hypothetical protein